MFKQKIFLVNFDSLYEIFNEIKENFSFEIKNFENETDLIKTYATDIPLNYCITPNKIYQF